MNYLPMNLPFRICSEDPNRRQGIQAGVGGEHRRNWPWPVLREGKWGMHLELMAVLRYGEWKKMVTMGGETFTS